MFLLTSSKPIPLLLNPCLESLGFSSGSTGDAAGTSRDLRRPIRFTAGKDPQQRHKKGKATPLGKEQWYSRSLGSPVIPFQPAVNIEFL